MKILIFAVILLLALCSVVPPLLASEFPALEAIFSFLGGGGGDYFSNKTKKSIDQMTAEELGQSRGKCYVRDYEEHLRNQMCLPEDYSIAHLLELEAQTSETVRKPPIMVKCLQDEVAADNASVVAPNELRLMTSVKDIIELLNPVGNATKRHEPGSCVIVLFYTPSSLGCAHVAPYANVLPLQFPTLRFAAIDAYRFPSFNTEFGIVGLPTLMLFHQGRPIVKFYSDVGTFHAFVTRHTGIPQADPLPLQSDVTGPLPTVPIPETDYALLLAWLFILFCIGHFFTKSRIYGQIVEMIKRNWRESEAQLERN